MYSIIIKIPLTRDSGLSIQWIGSPLPRQTPCAQERLVAQPCLLAADIMARLNSWKVCSNILAKIRALRCLTGEMRPTFLGAELRPVFCVTYSRHTSRREMALAACD